MNTRTATRVALGAVVVLGLLAGRAGAAETAIVSAVGMSYLPPVVTVHEGEGLRFVQVDAGRLHDVTSDARDAARSPLFASSPAMTAGQADVVRGVEDLTAGDYGFHCSIHPGMKGTLVVRAAGVTN